MNSKSKSFIKDYQNVLENTFKAYDHALEVFRPKLQLEEVGRVVSIQQNVANVRGLPSVKFEELVRFETGDYGLALNLDPESLGIVVLSQSRWIKAGTRVYRTNRVFDMPVGAGLLGRVVNAVGEPLDEKRQLRIEERLPIERPAPSIMDRAPVKRPLQTGIKVIDALIPIGRGQRELILGDRQTGKSSIALDTIINQKGRGVVCIYCAIGQRNAAVARFIADLRKFGAMDYSVVVVASGVDTPGLRYVAPYGATSIAEYFMERGQDTLIIYDDLTRHARAYRELSLLLRRPPGREAYPGDIFFIHSRLLERSTQYSEENGGGSLTALPIIETQAQNISAYIPTNLISITDGQIYLSPELFQKGVLPAVDVGQSVSRVGGKAQLPAFQRVAGDLNLSYSQYQELEVFARFGTQLEKETQQQLERGRRVRETLKQPLNEPIPVDEQIAVFIAVNEGLFDDFPIDEVSQKAKTVRYIMRNQLTDLSRKIREGIELSDEDVDRIVEIFKDALESED